MKKRAIRQGYKPYDRREENILRSRKYPFVLLKPGQFLDEKFPMEEKLKVRAAVSYYRKKHGMDLHISYFHKGTDKHKAPHMVVGCRKPQSDNLT